MNNSHLESLCFDDIQGKNNWGYSKKRITIKIKGTLTDKLVFTGFGYKSRDNKYSIGVRMWIDQGDIAKFIPYNKNKTINSHFIELIQLFTTEYNMRFR
tara:strand:- start:273 stop:569 length:297 start_codon:yes stop_codon:yes gene_type:complete